MRRRYESDRCVNGLKADFEQAEASAPFISSIPFPLTRKGEREQMIKKISGAIEKDNWKESLKEWICNNQLELEYLISFVVFTIILILLIWSGVW